MDKPLVVAFSASMTCHAIFLGVQLIHVTQQLKQLDQKPLKIVYEFQEAEQEMMRLQREVAKLEASGGSSSLPGLANPSPQIRIPDRATLSLPAPSGVGEVNRSTVVDLTNLVEAAQGDPILLSYFSAIREKIQSTANKQTWMGEGTQGLVYISFVLSDTGQIQSPQILTDRSESSKALQEIALKIIRGSNPFPPFPPSLKESSRTVVVPLEFLLGAQTG